jgi:hypothetical protein
MPHPERLGRLPFGPAALVAMRFFLQQACGYLGWYPRHSGPDKQECDVALLGLCGCLRKARVLRPCTHARSHTGTHAHATRMSHADPLRRTPARARTHTFTRTEPYLNRQCCSGYCGSGRRCAGNCSGTHEALQRVLQRLLTGGGAAAREEAASVRGPFRGGAAVAAPRRGACAGGAALAGGSAPSGHSAGGAGFGSGAAAREEAASVRGPFRGGAAEL